MLPLPPPKITYINIKQTNFDNLGASKREIKEKSNFTDCGMWNTKEEKIWFRNVIIFLFSKRNGSVCEEEKKMWKLFLIKVNDERNKNFKDVMRHGTHGISLWI